MFRGSFDDDKEHWDSCSKVPVCACVWCSLLEVREIFTNGPRRCVFYRQLRFKKSLAPFGGRGLCSFFCAEEIKLGLFSFASFPASDERQRELTNCHRSQVPRLSALCKLLFVCADRLLSSSSPFTTSGKVRAKNSQICAQKIRGNEGQLCLDSLGFSSPWVSNFLTAARSVFFCVIL